MAEVIPGGVYKNAVGDGYHNGDGQPVTEDGKLLDAPDSVAASQALAERDAAEARAASLQAELDALKAAQAPPAKPEPKPAKA